MKWTKKTNLPETSFSHILSIIKTPYVFQLGSYNVVTNIRPLKYAGIGSLTFCAFTEDQEVISLVNNNEGSIIIIDSLLKDKVSKKDTASLILVRNAKDVFALIVSELKRNELKDNFLYSSDLFYGEDCVLGLNIKFGRGVIIGDRVSIGDNCLIYPNVVIYNDVSIGDNTIIHAGCIIGHPGLGTVMNQDIKSQFPDLGGVEIGNNVYIGANSTIAKSPIGNTVIEDNVKIGNLVNIGHNVYIQKDSVITSSSSIGRSVIGENTFLSLGSLIRPGIAIGNDSVIGIGSVVVKDIPNKTCVYGNPAKKH
jgi:UDP-3-O-[3-hydroxymyristoyl] glucosamine N-acyltransferase